MTPRNAFALFAVLSSTAVTGCEPHVVGMTSVMPLRPTSVAEAPREAPAASPRVAVEADKIVITEKIVFQANSAKILSQSEGLMSEIAKVLEKNRQIRKVAIEGYASADGNVRSNQKLSALRAKSVMDFLVVKGVEKERLTSRGFGAEHPIDDNATEAGREKNRRVEFKIIEQLANQKGVAQ